MSLYGLIIGICISIGIEYFTRHNKLVKKKEETKFIVTILAISILGARLYHVLDYFSYYTSNPFQIFNLRAGGLGIFGALIAAIGYLYLYSRSRKIQFIKLTDSIVPVIPLCQSIGRWGNFFNREVYSLSGLPVWFYESILNFTLFLFLIKIKNRHTSAYLIGYGTYRFFLEFIRHDTWTLYNLKIGQVFSILFIAVGLLFLKNSSKRKIK